MRKPLALEFTEREAVYSVPRCREADLAICYKGRALRCEYRADFLCFGAVVVELKAVSALISGHRALGSQRTQSHRLFGLGLLIQLRRAQP